MTVRSVLRVSDQRAGRFPTVCVLSGVETNTAVRVRANDWRGPRWLMFVPGLTSAIAWLARRNHFRVSLPVSADVWKRWRRRSLAGQAAVTFGVVLVVAGVVGRQLPPGVLGLLVLAGGLALWARAHRNWWLTCRFDPVETIVTVEPAHSRFDDQARALFVRSLR